MNVYGQIDNTFDFRSDTPPGKDPDSYSPTLRRYHKLLWSKPLPSGVIFELVDTTPQVYLHHKSVTGEFWLSSDAIIPTFSRAKKIAHIIKQIPKEELGFFQTIGYTIGGMMIFPGNRIGNKMTINGARGFHPLTKDRFDLTVECIRRHYFGESSPLDETLARYADYFAIFQDFRGYVEFFMLQDMITDDFTTVKFFTPFDDFKTSPFPSTVKAYTAYRDVAVEFIKARNHRISEYCRTNQQYYPLGNLNIRNRTKLPDDPIIVKKPGISCQVNQCLNTERNGRVTMKLLLHNYEGELAHLAERATEIKVAIAFLTDSGLGWLPPHVAPHAEFVVGIDLGITSNNALRTLQQQGAAVMVYSEPGRLFHPKVIYLRSEDDEILIVGSNNLTSGGISSNHEVSLVVTRNEVSEAAFIEFIWYFESLKAHACCRIPDKQFYETYKPTALRQKLAEQLRQQQIDPIFHPTLKIEDMHISTVGDFLRLLAEEYPKLERRHYGTVKGHPLKLLNDDEFKPLFTDMVTRISKGRMTGHSRLNIGGRWYQIPNILAINRDREPWELTHSTGQLGLQIHFSHDFTRVFQSVVLRYNLHQSIDAKEMPPQLEQRYRKLIQYVEIASNRGTFDLPVFKHFNYKKDVYWNKPIISFDYPVDSLPDDEILCKDMEFLVSIVNGEPGNS